MKTLSGLDEAVNSLQQHENSTRIKKLIFGACYNNWENDLTYLDRFPLEYLIPQLFQLNPTREDLKSTLDKVVQTLNKPDEYALIANIIISSMEKFYLLAEQATEVVEKPVSSATIVQAVDRGVQTQLQPLKAPYDPFALRLEIMQYTNPLRAKILIYSTLYQQLDITEKELSAIRSHQLDELIEDLFYYCETLKELEARLSSTARCLFEENENYQAASAIVQALKPFYVDRQPGMYKRPPVIGKRLGKDTTIGFEFDSDRNITDGNSNNKDGTCQVNRPFKK